MSTHGSTDPEILPEPGMVRLGPLVAWQPDGSYSMTIWHWCDRSGWRAKAQREGWTPDEDAIAACWAPASASAHEIVSLDPLHLEPSVYWPDCCGLHGFIRAGEWVEC